MSTPNPYQPGEQSVPDGHRPGEPGTFDPYRLENQGQGDPAGGPDSGYPAGSGTDACWQAGTGPDTGYAAGTGSDAGWHAVSGPDVRTSTGMPAGQNYHSYDYAMGQAGDPEPAYAAAAGGYPPAAGGATGPGGGPGVPGGDWTGAGGAAQSSRRPRGRAPWVALVGTAALAAGLASGGTAALLHLQDDEPAAQDQMGSSSSSQNVPVVAAADGTPDWEGVAAAVRPAVVAIDVAGRGGSGAGSGMVWDADGHIVTNNHVVAGAEQIVVTLADGRMFEAETVGTDPITDLAVLALVDAPSDLELPVIGESGDLDVGRPVMAVGNPLGLSSTVTTGIISALDRPVTAGEGQGQAPTVTNAIQIDAAINPGNSGGPLFDSEGRVIGITSAIASLSGGQSGSIGLGFAIPVDLVGTITEQLIETGTAEHAFLGVALSEETVTADGVTRSGAGVQSVEPGSPADDAGLAVGDVITAIDDRPVSSAAALTGYVRAHTAGEKVGLAVVRDGELTEVEVTLATTAEQTS